MNTADPFTLIVELFEAFSNSTKSDPFIAIEFVSLGLLLKQILIAIFALGLIFQFVRVMGFFDDVQSTPHTTTSTIFDETEGEEEDEYQSPWDWNDDEDDDEYEDDEYITCVYCGTSNDLDARSCIACGAPRRTAFA